MDVKHTYCELRWDLIEQTHVCELGCVKLDLKCMNVTRCGLNGVNFTWFKLDGCVYDGWDSNWIGVMI